MALFGIADCNNFYVSCERSFQPRLEGRPVVVLSNNDGCAIARSSEAKALGVSMGAPWFKIRHLTETEGLVAVSSNYALYGDLSMRVMSILADQVPATEVYSIDECFLDLDNLAVPDLTEWLRGLRSRVRQWTGIPISIGVGPTKTLAKIANHLAKTSPKAGGVLDLSRRADWREIALKRTPVSDVWGIGWQWTGLCVMNGIRTAWDLHQADDGWVRAKMGTVGMRTVMELRGVAVHGLEAEAADRQSCCVSRSFGEATAEYGHVRDALVEYAAAAAGKLRRDGLLAGIVQVFAMTDRFRRDLPQYSGSASVTLSSPSASSREIIAAALKGLDRLWKEKFAYRKAGVILLDLVRPENVPRDLFSPPPEKPDSLMSALDRIESRFGRGGVRFGLARPDAPWRMRQAMRSPCWTTRWEDVPTARLE
ncbi:Y-family DNA polymerase [Telmatospirillum sp. J64-1]|uniref:Y-family DNA polymerase n=1 Tax=Telmatospirillum sp. J64-1 TaxID=2502183 RepID=UPI00115CAF91|nr:Y-family DNA polymerase [Telmatospirillum sp. J64-1]